MIAANPAPLIATMRRSRYRLAVLVALILAGGSAHAATAVVDLRSHSSGPTWFISFVMVPPTKAGIDPSALVVWGDPHAANAAYETVGLITTGGNDAGAVSYFGRVADIPVQQMHFEQLMDGSSQSRMATDALTLLVDADAFKDAHEVFGGVRNGTYFEDQTITAGDSAARNHGIAQIISYFAGIGARLGESVPDTLHLASAAGDDPPGLAKTFSPDVYLRNMIATATAQRDVYDVCGSWSGETFGKWPNGVGQFSYLSGAIYNGEVHRGRQRGRGTWQGTDGLTISGTFDGGEPTDAIVRFPDGDAFSGTLRNDRALRGTYQWRDGTRYVGSFGLSEQLVDGTLTTPAGETVNVANGAIQSSIPSMALATLPSVDHLLAYSIDFCH